ncbi:transcriptional activator HAC1 [Trichoderma virens Gv29-8]|uniref:Transcriptional activator HAC1 n=1 Tax=Hypocrea virens (strain Gv29-8 / FGSC 10586) TaxID=413071 RepID=G9MRQ4_HYPVG|nr:transcriptional activator HAC1 [Trichoderma virens Gv29-8]EHK22773.1 transcriptional activator HAC1 [Trichoderma virens Gv29-8]
MAFQQSPLLKYEASPAESFLSAPGDNFSSLFADSSSIPSTLNPKEMMTPDSFADGLDSRLSAIPESPEADNDDIGTPADSSTSEKKPVKKRKSWGQVLPEPKTNLPPRKRAKTEDEKEQRRVERVLRNRRAAQSSRERKRLEVEALEKRNKELETLLHNAQKTNLILVEELNRFRRSSGVVTRSSSPLDSLQDNITLSQQLFGSQDGQNITTEQSLMDQMMRSAVNPTVNPASLSPALTPIPDKEFPQEDEEQDEEAEEEEEKISQQTVSTDSTQHVVRPAVSIGGDAPVPVFSHSSANCLGLDPVHQDDVPFSLGAAFGLSTALDADRYVLESSLLASPDSTTLDDDYMVGDSATCFTNPLPSDYDFDINDFLTDDANHAAYDIVAASNYAAADHELDLEIHDLETQISSDHPIQQPQLGASSSGCDAGGIAVGV